MALLNRFVDRGITVIVIEHNTDVMRLADYIIDIGPDGGTKGGKVVFTGTPQEMIEHSDTITARCLRLCDHGEPLPREKWQEEWTNEEEEDMAGLRLQPIGRVESDCGEFKVMLDSRYKEALTGLEGFSHIQVLWWFDGCDNERDRSVLVNEKPYTKGPDTMGTFATRSPQRPNPIAVTTAQVLSIDQEHAIINLAYIDALTGTPVLDIKPYTPSVDKVDTAQVPQWCAHWPGSYEAGGDFDWEKEFNF